MKHLVFLLALAWLLGCASATAQTLARPDASEHARTVTAFQTELNAEYRNPAKTPLSPKALRSFAGLSFYPTSYAACVVARFERDSLAQPFAMETSTAQRPLYRKYGTLRFELNGQPLQLTVYQSLELLNKAGFEDYLFVPFTDRTNGRGSYGGGRYLDLRQREIQRGQVLLDFNRAYNPYCAYRNIYSCPVPPAENRLPVAIEAGVRSDH